jgi:Ion channel
VRFKHTGDTVIGPARHNRRGNTMDTGDFLGGELLLGIAISLINIAVHSMVMAVLSRATHRTSLAVEAARAWLRLVLVMWSAVTILMLAHLVEVAIWAGAYRVLNLTPQPLDSFYFAFVNYTTLGYGDILPAKDWRLLGPITAMNGVLLFGWSTAVIFDILRTIGGIIAVRPTQTSPPR